MNDLPIQNLQHEHVFNQDQIKSGEQKTFVVIVLTALMMIVEITAGILTGSMALLADGLHMASHATALGINGFAYRYARRHAGSQRYSFGTGKVNALGGFSGAVLLAVFALLMAWQSALHLISPVIIEFNQAIAVAVIGLLVNGASVFILAGKSDHGHSHSHEDHENHEHDHSHSDHDHHDHNLKSAYLHVMADALTSVLAIAALVSGKYFGLVWMDPLMGIVGAVLVSRWSLGLLRSTSSVLLDEQAADKFQKFVTDKMEQDGDCRVTDLHVWSVGPDIYAAVISLATRNPKSPDIYKARVASESKLVHVTVEVNPVSAAAQ